MEIKKGDKLILEPVEVLDVNNYEVYLTIGDSAPVCVLKEKLKHARKVLGLLGDEGLEPKVGMKVWCEAFGDGVIDRIDIATPTGLEIEVLFHGDDEYFTKDGVYQDGAGRSLYVTALPEEPKGWAVFRPINYPSPLVSTEDMTKEEAEEIYGERLIHWIPESEMKK